MLYHLHLRGCFSVVLRKQKHLVCGYPGSGKTVMLALLHTYTSVQFVLSVALPYNRA